MATHSSILAWKTPWTEEPGGLQSMGSQRVGHDLVTEQQLKFGGFLGGTSGEESTCQCGTCKRRAFSPWVGKLPWRRNGSPLQYSCLENPMDRGAWWAAVRGVTRSQT